MESKYNNKQKEIQKERVNYENKMKELYDKLAIAKNQYLQIDSSYKSLRDDKNKNSDTLKKCLNEIDTLKLEFAKKENLLNSKLDDCNNSLKIKINEKIDCQDQLTKMKNKLKNCSKVLF